MKRFFVIGFLVLLAFDTISQVSFKLAGVDTQPSCDLGWLWRVLSNQWTYGAIFGYLGAFITWMTLLEHAPIGPAFAITHLDVVSVAIVSFFLFGERLSLAQIIGCLLILAGIFVLAYSKERDGNASG